MPTFFFRTGTDTGDRDDEGVELATVNEARRQAIIFAGNLLSDDPELLHESTAFRVAVTDARRLVLAEIVIRIVDHPPER